MKCPSCGEDDGPLCHDCGNCKANCCDCAQLYTVTATIMIMSDDGVSVIGPGLAEMMVREHLESGEHIRVKELDVKLTGWL